MECYEKPEVSYAKVRVKFDFYQVSDNLSIVTNYIGLTEAVIIFLVV